MTKQQKRILKNYLKTIGFVETTTKFSYFDEKEKVSNEIFDAKQAIKEIKGFKESDKAALILSQEIIRKTKQNPNSTEEDYNTLKEVVKNFQKEYDKTLEYLKKEQYNLYRLETRLSELNLHEEEIKDFSFDFGPNVRNETGNICTSCHDSTDAYLQVNPYRAEIDGVTEMIMVCDSCAAAIAEEI